MRRDILQEKERIKMPQQKLCRTVCQVNKEAVSKTDLKRLMEIADDYCAVKNYVYQRYGGIRSLSKLYPGYTIQNEMTKSGLREELNMPSVYFYLAVFDALGDIKSQWTRTKSAVQELVNQNEHFTQEEKHFLRFILKVSNAFEQVLNDCPVKLPKEMNEKYKALAAKTDEGRLCRWLCRKVRKKHVKLHTDSRTVFTMTERAYRYADHGIYISAKEKRKRIFVPLTDSCQYKRQLTVRLYPERAGIEIRVPLDVNVRIHTDYEKRVGLAAGMFTMLTTDEGHAYGEELGEYQSAYADWVRKQTSSYQRNRKDNPGRKKYFAKKRRFEEQLHSYINHELNRFIETEKPRTVYLPKLPKPQAGGISRHINYAVTMWQRGYIRRRLEQKCRQESVEIIEVFGRGISSECSSCGADGTKTGGIFYCPRCGFRENEKTNTARNAKKRGESE